MFEAQLLYGTSTVYSPWFPRAGDYAIATIDVMDLSGASVQIDLYTKNEEDKGDGTKVDSTVNIRATSVGRHSAEWGPNGSDGILELVRYRIEVSTTDTQWALFRMLDLVWFDAVKA